MNWAQLRALLWLRSHLTRNQWRRTGGLGAVIAAVVALFAALLGLAVFGGGLLGGIELGSAPTEIVGIVWFVATMMFLLFWMGGVVSELQRSETIDLQKLMHLPTRLGQIFVLNYVASHFVLSLLVVVPGMIGASIGLAFAKGPRMLLMIPMVISLVLMVTAWTYRLRGWLATLVSNPRKRRSAIMIATLGIVLIAQLPNLYFNVLRSDSALSRRHRTATKKKVPPADAFQGSGELLEIAEAVAPPLWLSGASVALVEKRPLPALLRMMGCLLFAVLGLTGAYRSTLRFYRGETDSRAGSRRARKPAAASNLVAARVPFLPEQTSAVALTTLRSMLRAPEVKMGWLGSVIVTALVLGSLLFRLGDELPASGRPFAVLGLGAFSIFISLQFVTNQFGYDREGFRAFVLSPASRRAILAGKNVATVLVLSTIATVLITAAAFWLKIGLTAYLTALLELTTLLFAVMTAGNLLSVLFPFRIAPGSLKPSKASGLTVVIVLLSQLVVMPLVMGPAFLPTLVQLVCRESGVLPSVPVGFVLAFAFALLAGLVYTKLLGPLGTLLQNREQRILAAVTSEVE